MAQQPLHVCINCGVCRFCSYTQQRHKICGMTTNDAAVVVSKDDLFQFFNFSNVILLQKNNLYLAGTEGFCGSKNSQDRIRDTDNYVVVQPVRVVGVLVIKN